MNNIPPLYQSTYNALWLAEHFAGKRLGDRFFARPRLAVNAAIVDGLLERRPSPFNPLDQVDVEDTGAIAEGIRRRTPFVIKNAAKDWDCIGKWTPQYFANRFPQYPLEVRETESGGREVDRRTTFGDFVPTLLDGGRSYAKFSPILHDHPELKEDLNVEWLGKFTSPLEFWVANQFFMGAPETATKLHCAFISNFFVQIYGRKRWYLFSPDYNCVFMPPVERGVAVKCSPDFETPTFEEGSVFSRLNGYRADLEPGDVLFNPSFYWHYVENTTISIGLSCRYLSATKAIFSSPMLSLLTACARHPNAISALVAARKGIYDNPHL